MPHQASTFGHVLVRALGGAMVVFLLVCAYVLLAQVLAVRDVQPDRSAGLDSVSRHPEWRPGHARRFSGCVDIAAWTHPDVPVSVVAVEDSGRVTKMAFDEAFRRVATPSPADDVWTIGACVR
jgi:hypothetical protein